MKKTIAILALLLAVLLAFFLCARGDGRKSYDKAQTEAAQFLERNQSGLTALTEEILEQGSADGVSFPNVESIVYHEGEAGRFISFQLGSQGMLGGQYWGLSYSVDDRFDTTYTPWTDLGGGRAYYRQGSGNNFSAIQRLEEHWFFYYDDYDGNVHGLDWGAEESLSEESGV